MAKSLLGKNSAPDLRAMVYKGLARTYGSLNNYRKANEALLIFSSINDSISGMTKSAKYVLRLAEDEYGDILDREKHYQRMISFLASGIGIVLLSLFIISFIAYRLRQTYQTLISQSLELSLISEKPPIKCPAFETCVNREACLADCIGIDSTTISGNIPQEENVPKKIMDLCTEKEYALLAKFAKEMQRLLNQENIYRNPDLTIQDVSVRLKTNRTYLSKAIHTVLQTNFNTIINDLRIKEAIRKISEGEHEYMKLESLAQEVGFSNRNTFQVAFKKFTGVTPSYFIKNFPQSVTLSKMNLQENINI